jgi:hypothetical protein
MKLNDFTFCDELNDQEAENVSGGNVLLQPVPGSERTIPAGGPGYGFFQPPPANPIAFEKVFENVGS